MSCASQTNSAHIRNNVTVVVRVVEMLDPRRDDSDHLTPDWHKFFIATKADISQTQTVENNVIVASVNKICQSDQLFLLKFNSFTDKSLRQKYIGLID